MAYNGSGTYIPPAGQPVATGTVIQSSTFNTLVTDLGNTLNNTLPRDGQASMSAQLKLVDGTSSVPSIAFNSEASTGIFRPTTGALALVAGGVESLRINNAGRVLVGTTSDDGFNKLQVNGPTKVTGTLAATLFSGPVTGNVTGNVTGTAANVTGVVAIANGGTGAADAVTARTNLGLDQINNTSDANKPVSTATQTALNLKAPIASPVFTGAVVSVANGFTTVMGGDAAGSYLEAQGATALRLYTNSAERLRVATTGNVLIGTTVDGGTDKLQVFGKAAVSDTLSLGRNDYGWGLAPLNALTIRGDGVSGVYPPSQYRFYVTAGETISNGTLSIRAWDAIVGESLNVFTVRGNQGVTLAGYTLIEKVANNDAGEKIFAVTRQQTGTISLASYAVSQEVFSSANAANKMGRDTNTLRSLNAGGTINASGADYAEYMTKADDCGTIAKGQIVGINADGKLTDKWAEALSFLIKSTDPSYVGGDTWGSEESLGVSRPTDETSETYEADLAAFNAALEVARQKVDRIAFAGQVPVNVLGATPGQVIIAVQDGDGIKGIAVNEDDLTLKQYIKAVGTVQNILADGRANVRVKVA